MVQSAFCNFLENRLGLSCLLIQHQTEALTQTQRYVTRWIWLHRHGYNRVLSLSKDYQTQRKLITRIFTEFMLSAAYQAANVTACGREATSCL